MSGSLYSQSWYRVAGLKPRLRSHARIHRHDYRDEVWYVLEDASSGRCHRFSVAAHYLIGLMDGERTVQQIWEAAVARLGDDAPTHQPSQWRLADPAYGERRDRAQRASGQFAAEAGHPR
jgi:putative peptide zinc metalloprotease protein